MAGRASADCGDEEVGQLFILLPQRVDFLDSEQID
jgi:hypothetical protein